jgi:non-heme chloroperoxidase
MDRNHHGWPLTADDWDAQAADVALLAAHLDLRNAIHVGHSTGGGEVARYVARHGQGRVAKAVVIGAVPPIMVKTARNPAGLPIEAFGESQRNRTEGHRNRALIVPLV